LIHGEVDPNEVYIAALRGIEAGVETLAYRYRHGEEPSWLPRLRVAMLDHEPKRCVLAGSQSKAVLLAWAAALRTT
jgi:hypothetical protein